MYTEQLTKFREDMLMRNLSRNTIAAYQGRITDYLARHKVINKNNLLIWKADLLDRAKPRTVQNSIVAMNAFLDFINKPKLKLSGVKIQQQLFLENVISEADYEYLKECLKRDGNLYMYFAVRFLGATGARISEFVRFKVEHLRAGYFDIHSKHGKVRRLYIPKALREEAIQWVESEGRRSGWLFLRPVWVNQEDNNETRLERSIQRGEPALPRTISNQLKKCAKMYGIDPKVMYPHSFRHRYAKNFIERYNDIALLADLMGHEKIETTRIYLRRTAGEQQALVDSIITW